MPACNDHACLARFFRAAADDLARDFAGQVVRQGGYVESQERLPTHRVYIRQAVGSGDGTEIVGIVHDGREEIRADHKGALLIQAPDSRVIRLPQTDQKVRERIGVEHLLNGTQNLRQRLRA